MTRFSLRFWRSKTAALAFIAATLAAPLAASPALAAGWDHGRDESRPIAWHRDRDDWRRPVVVAPAPVYGAPVYAAPPAVVPGVPVYGSVGFGYGGWHGGPGHWRR